MLSLILALVLSLVVNLYINSVALRLVPVLLKEPLVGISHLDSL
jgi:hypothetical protein